MRSACHCGVCWIRVLGILLFFMEFLRQALDVFIHLDQHLTSVIATYGSWTYALLFLIVLLETGAVLTPFLPGDSLLFAAGTFAAQGSLRLSVLFLLFSIAAIAGDAVNYTIGHFIGPKLFRQEHSRFLNRAHLKRTEAFYEQHGTKTIILARFIPIIRTFAPFVAGIGNMPYATFALYNIIGGLLWVTLFLGGGYVFGNIPVVRNNFEVVILGIIAISMLPAIYHVFKEKMKHTV